MEDILIKKNPWEGDSCTRNKCLLCTTKLKDEKIPKKSCSKRNLVYRTCYERDKPAGEGDKGEGEGVKRSENTFI